MNELSNWWSLPGPSSYVAAIADSVRREINVVLCLPAHLPKGLEQILSREFEETRRWQIVRAAEVSEETPAQFLCRPLDFPFGAIRNAAALCSAAAFNNRVIWLEVSHQAVWRPWREFLVEYQNACRQRRPPGRAVFCAALENQMALDPPPEGDYLKHHRWHGCIDSLDMTMFVAKALRNLPFTPSLSGRLLRKTLIAVISSLAQYDPVLAERLACESLETILNLQALTAVLKSFGHERGWRPDQKPNWHSGMKDKTDGLTRIHSAALALNHQVDEIEGRIWSGQVGVLFPFIEEQRQFILDDERLRAFRWNFPPPVNGNEITDKQGLEVGHLAFQLENSSLRFQREFRELIQRAKDLREIRNRLAHRQPIDLSMLKRCDEIHQATAKKTAFETT